MLLVDGFQHTHEKSRVSPELKAVLGFNIESSSRMSGVA